MRFRRLASAGTTISQLLNTVIVDGDEVVDIGRLKGLPLKAYIGLEEAAEGDGHGALDIDKPVRAIALSVEGRHIRDALDVFTDKATGTDNPTAIALLNRSIGTVRRRATSSAVWSRRRPICRRLRSTPASRSRCRKCMKRSGLGWRR